MENQELLREVEFDKIRFDMPIKTTLMDRNGVGTPHTLSILKVDPVKKLIFAQGFGTGLQIYHKLYQRPGDRFYITK